MGRVHDVRPGQGQDVAVAVQGQGMVPERFAPVVVLRQAEGLLHRPGRPVEEQDALFEGCRQRVCHRRSAGLAPSANLSASYGNGPHCMSAIEVLSSRPEVSS